MRCVDHFSCSTRFNTYWVGRNASTLENSVAIHNVFHACRYTNSSNLDFVRLHVTIGFATAVVAVPFALLTHLVTACAKPSVQIASLVILTVFTLATAATVIPMGSFTRLGQLAGESVVVSE